VDLVIENESITRLVDHAQVPIAFEVTSRYRPEPIEQGLGGIRLVEEPVYPAYVKDYDATAGEGPGRWLKRWDTSSWGLLTARIGSQRVGGAVLACRTDNVHMLERRDDLAALWDFRVHPDFREAGLGTKLFEASANWARQNECTELKIETQNINVPACRFYARQGCKLSAIVPHAYAGELPDEIQFIWRISL